MCGSRRAVALGSARVGVPPIRPGAPHESAHPVVNLRVGAFVVAGPFPAVCPVSLCDGSGGPDVGQLLSVPGDQAVLAAGVELDPLRGEVGCSGLVALVGKSPFLGATGNHRGHCLSRLSAHGPEYLPRDRIHQGLNAKEPLPWGKGSSFRSVSRSGRRSAGPIRGTSPCHRPPDVSVRAHPRRRLPAHRIPGICFAEARLHLLGDHVVGERLRDRVAGGP